ncbi:Endoribonuclease [Aphelenchoides besseyi]|nr:Endoribonuclease [Aphelenchoides besseyi]KAI6200669.1 Endoribonuclease [Aphelenchoides besseyi]
MKATVLVCSLGFLSLVNSLNAIPDFKVSDDAIVQLVNMMREADTEKPNFCDVHLNYQNQFNGREAAPNNLFKSVNPALFKRPSFAKLLALRKHFNPSTGVAEVQSQAKIQAIKDFFETVWNSGPFKKLIEFVRAHNHPWAKDSNTFRQAIMSIWFDTFSRAKGRLDSSAFEHVFFGEVKNQEVSGMHNWAVMADLERTPSENFNYRGFMRKNFDVIAEVNLMWRGVEKPQGSFLANSSPAFDFSFLTACFLAHRGPGNKCFAVIDGCNVAVQSYEQSQNGKVFIGTVYPAIGRNSPTCQKSYNQRETCCLKT